MSSMEKPQSLRVSWLDHLQFIALWPRDILLYLICLSYPSFIWGFNRLTPRYLAWTGRVRARDERVERREDDGEDIDCLF